MLPFVTPMFNGTGGPLTQTITTTGAGSYTFTRAGSLTLQGISGGASGNKSTGTGVSGGGGGGESDNVGSPITVKAGDILYWNVGSGGAALTSSSNTSNAGSDTWAQLNTNAAPSLSTKGIVAKGAPATGTGQGSGASTFNSIGARKYAGGAGNLGGGGGSSAAPGSSGVDASSQTGATAPAGGGNGGNGSSTAPTNGAQPGGGGGAALVTTAGVPSGKGGDGQLIFTLT